MKRQSNIYNLSRKEQIDALRDGLAAQFQAFENLESSGEPGRSYLKKELTAILRFLISIASIFDSLAIPHPDIDRGIKRLTNIRNLLFLGNSEHLNPRLSTEATNEIMDNMDDIFFAVDAENDLIIAEINAKIDELSRITPRTIFMDISYAVKSCWNWGVHVIANAKHKLKLWFHGGANNTTAFASSESAAVPTQHNIDPYALKLDELRARVQAAKKFHKGFDGANKFYGDTCPNFNKFKAAAIRKNNQTLRDLAQEITVTRLHIDAKNKPAAL